VKVLNEELAPGGDFDRGSKVHGEAAHPLCSLLTTQG